MSASISNLPTPSRGQPIDVGHPFWQSEAWDEAPTNIEWWEYISWAILDPSCVDVLERSVLWYRSTQGIGWKLHLRRRACVYAGACSMERYRRWSLLTVEVWWMTMLFVHSTVRWEVRWHNTYCTLTLLHCVLLGTRTLSGQQNNHYNGSKRSQPLSGSHPMKLLVQEIGWMF